MSVQPRDEAGITLIELLISIILLGIIIVPLTGAFIDGINSTTASQKRLSESRSPMFTNAYFAEDVQSSDAGGVTTAADTTTPTCGSNGTNVVSFAWSEGMAPNAVQYGVSYVLAPSGAKTVLKRNYCVNGSPSTIVVAPVLGGDAGCGAPACATKGPPDSTGLLRTVTLTASTPNSENNYFTLTGTRRAT